MSLGEKGANKKLNELKFAIRFADSALDGGDRKRLLARAGVGRRAKRLNGGPTSLFSQVL